MSRKNLLLLDTGGHLGSLLAMILSGWLIDYFGSYSAVLFVLCIVGLIGFLGAMMIKE